MPATDYIAGATTLFTVVSSLIIALAKTYGALRRARRELAEVAAQREQQPSLPAITTGTFSAMIDPMERPRILVVDDEPSLRRFLRKALDREGYAVDCVATSDEAIVLAHTYTYAVQIVDRVLHGSTLQGVDVLRRLRRLRPRAIFYSGALTEADQELVEREQIADCLLEKGGDLTALMDVVTAQVDAWRVQVGLPPRPRPPADPPT